MTPYHYKILKAIYELSEEISYNVYESADVAYYAKTCVASVELACQEMLGSGLLNECMTYEDDGIVTYHLSHRGLTLLEEQKCLS